MFSLAPMQSCFALISNLECRFMRTRYRSMQYGICYVWRGTSTFDPKHNLHQVRKFQRWSWKSVHVDLESSIPPSQALASSPMVEWQEGLQQKGIYYEGIIDGCRLDGVLELHRLSTISTFGTRRSSRVSATAQAEKQTNNEMLKYNNKSHKISSNAKN